MAKIDWSSLWRKEDWWAVWFGFVLIILSLAGIITSVAKIARWTDSIGVAFKDGALIVPLIYLLVGTAILFAVGIRSMGESVGKFIAAYPIVFIFAIVAYVLDGQKTVQAWGLGYAFWALLFGLIISNTVGTPSFIKPAVKTEMYIKTGLVLLGAEILFGVILRLGGPGLIVAWVVTPIVVLVMWYYGTRILKMASKPFVITIACATSVCGVSAAIAAAAASKAKKEELTLAIGMSLIFTVLMMVFMPMFIRAVGIGEILGGAWMGGTIDSTGAVVAAGTMLGSNAMKVAAVVKMIQNVLIGVFGFMIAVYWVTRIEVQAGGAKPSLWEIWFRFPKFIVGFVAASLIYSFILVPLMGEADVSKFTRATTRALRDWFFCLAFISIGLDSNFRELAHTMAGGKPLWLYIVGQSFNLVLTLFVAWLVFGGILFPVPVF